MANSSEQPFPLHAAVFSANSTLVGRLISEVNIDVNVKDDKGETPLFVSTLTNSHLPCMKLLLEASADPLIKDNLGRTSLFCAAEKNRVKVARSLLNNVLYLPSQNASGNRLKNLLEVRNNDGKTALEVAFSYGPSHKPVQSVIQEFENKVGIRSVPIPPIEEELLFQLRLLQTLLLKKLTGVVEDSMLKFEEVGKASGAPGSLFDASRNLQLEFAEMGGKPALERNSTNYISNSRKKGLVSIKLANKLNVAIINALLMSPVGTRLLLQHPSNVMQLLLRLAQDTSDDGTESNVLSQEELLLLSVLSFEVFQETVEAFPSDAQEGALLRNLFLQSGVMKLILAALAVLTHQTDSVPFIIQPFNVTLLLGSPQSAHPVDAQPGTSSNPRQQAHWARGTGFGTGSTESKNALSTTDRRKVQDKQTTCIFQALAAFVCPLAPDSNPILVFTELRDQMERFHTMTAIYQLLQNDSVTDIADNIPLYLALLRLVQALAAIPDLVPLLNLNSQSISGALSRLYICLTEYKIYLPLAQNGASADEAIPSDGIESLLEDVMLARSIVESVAGCSSEDEENGECESCADPSSSTATSCQVSPTDDAIYCQRMRPFHFLSYPFEDNDDNLADNVSLEVPKAAYYFKQAIREARLNFHPNRSRRIAQEVASLKKSLPLSSSSSIFLCHDSDRVDAVKVLITGPAGTPYSNGCFEFDVLFPADYPASPMTVQLITTGTNLNPNLYDNGKVCLSLLNTWPGEPQEKWNPQTSSLYQVLVSIQSMILVSEPYFNEPGYERSRGTREGIKKSLEYDYNVRVNTFRVAILRQLMNPSPCFKEVIFNHFSHKRQEVEKQARDLMAELVEASAKEQDAIRLNPSRPRCETATFQYTSFKNLNDVLLKELAVLKDPSASNGVISPLPPTESPKVTYQQAGLSSDNEEESVSKKRKM